MNGTDQSRPQTAAPSTPSVSSQPPQPISTSTFGAKPPPSPPPSPAKSRKKLLFLILILFIISALGGVYFYWSQLKKPAPEVVKTSESREGKFIAINFDHYNPGALIPYAGIKDESEREKRLKDEREYADSLAKSIYSDLKSGNLTFEDVMEKVLNDPKVGAKSEYQTSLQSGSFTARDYIGKKGLLNDDAVRKKIDKIPQGQYSEPFVQQVDLSICEKTDPNCAPKYADARWLIVKVEKIL